MKKIAFLLLVGIVLAAGLLIIVNIIDSNTPIVSQISLSHQENAVEFVVYDNDINFKQPLRAKYISYYSTINPGTDLTINVIEKKDGKKDPVKYATVRIKGRDSGPFETYYTDSDGRVRIYNLENNCYDIKITKTNYKTKNAVVCLKNKNKVLEADFSIDEEEYPLRDFKRVW